MSLAPFALLAASLAIFLLSTRQFALAWRAQIWLVAAAVLIAAAFIAFDSPGRPGVVSLAFQHPYAFLDAIVANWPTVGGAVVPMFDIFLAVSILVAFTCLIAFTRGEAIEKAVRPFSIALIGAVAGGLVALVIAGVGFGGLVKRQVYLGVVEADDVIDGDTIRMGDISLRLWGIDAPESEQTCSDAAGHSVDAGKRSHEHLVSLVRDKLVVCAKPLAGKAIRETFGRPIVACRVGGGRTDIAEAMAIDGFAWLFTDHGKVTSSYEAQVSDAIAEHRGLHAYTCVAPELWRNPTRRTLALRFQFVDDAAGHRIGHAQSAAEILQQVAHLAEHAPHLGPRRDDGIEVLPLADEAVGTIADLHQRALDEPLEVRIHRLVQVLIRLLLARLHLHADDVVGRHVSLLAYVPAHEPYARPGARAQP